MSNLKFYGVGRRGLADLLFAEDKPPPRLGIYDEDDESLCHNVIKSTCQVPGCTFSAQSLLEFESHYNASHRYSCNECKKVLPSPHLLDLHIQEKHDSFFAVLALKKPSYCCYIEECKEKFLNADERIYHCVKAHKIPKDFRFDQTPKTQKEKAKKKNFKINNIPMETDAEGSVVKLNTFTFSNNKQRAFAKYSGRKFFGSSEEQSSKDVNMDVIIEDLKGSLPQ